MFRRSCGGTTGCGSSSYTGIGRTSSSHNRRNAGRGPAFLGKFALGYFHSAARSRSRPGPPPMGAGRFILALTGDREVEYPPAGANALTVGAIWRDGVKGAFSPFPAWALTYGFLAGCREPLLLSGCRSVIPACTFGWID